MSRDEQVAAALERLFLTYPSFVRSDDPSERVKAAAVYFDALAQYEVRDIETAVANLLNGSAPGVNPSFAPPAPAVASEVRRCLNLRLDAEARRFAPRGSLPPPTIERTPESRERVAAKLREGIANLASAMLTEDAEAAHRRAKFNERMSARFDPQSEREAAARLGYSVGESDIDGDMGGRAATGG